MQAVEEGAGTRGTSYRQAAAEAEAEAAETEMSGRRGGSGSGSGPSASIAGNGSSDVAGRGSGVELAPCVGSSGASGGVSCSGSESSPVADPTPPGTSAGRNSKGVPGRMVMPGSMGARRFQQLDERKRVPAQGLASGELSDELSIDDDDL